MTRLALAVPGRAARFSFFLFLTLALASTAQAGVIVSRSNNAGAGVDGGLQIREITFPPGDFPAGATITNVDITINFEKIDGAGPGSQFATCAQLGGPGHQGGNPWNGEIFMGLISPEGTGVVLVEDDLDFGLTGAGPTYTSIGTYGGPVTVRFTENTGTLVGGPAPVSGTFLPVQFLGYGGENPVGTWELWLVDNLEQDPLCSGRFTIDITTTGGGNFQIGSNMTGSFGDPAFSGSGINTEILFPQGVAKDGEKGGPGTVLLYWYTFDTFGFPIWSFGVGSFFGDTMVVDMLIDYDGNGPIFGPGFDPNDFEGLPFATVTIVWANCLQGLMSWVFDASFLSLNPGFVAHTMNLQRITNVFGLPSCP